MTMNILPDNGPYLGGGGFVGNEWTGTLAVSKIEAFASSLSAAAGAITKLIDTPFIPVSFWPTPNGVTLKDFPNPRIKHPRETAEEHLWRRQVACASASAAVLYGDEIGFTPIASLQAVYVVRGRPGLYAEAMVALLKAHGHGFFVEELTDSRCVVRARRAGDEEWQRFPFTIDRARKAGYVAQNVKYRDDPQSMLYARAASIACRVVAPDVLKGIMGVEELQDEPDTPAVSSGRAVKRSEPVRRPVPSVAGEQAPSGEQAPAQQRPAGPPLPGEDAPAVEMITERTWAKINQEFVRLEVVGIGQQANRLKVASRIAGRPITRGSDLTAAEAETVLSNLAGNVGFDVVAEALDLQREPVDGEPRDGLRDEGTGDADPDTDGDQEFDPTGDPSWNAEDGSPLAQERRAMSVPEHRVDDGWPALPGEAP